MNTSLGTRIPESRVHSAYHESQGGSLFGSSFLHLLPDLSLFLLGACLLLTNRRFTEVDDECAIIDRAAQPMLQTIRLYLGGAGWHEHPPLYDFILHGWLQLTRGEQHLLRLPSIIFYIAGAYVLASVAKLWAGGAARTYTLLLIVLWPYGFHFGRLATWYSFCFLLVALVTRTYFRYLEYPRVSTWFWLVACSVLLVYSNYFGWALLACLALDFSIRNRKMPLRTWAALAGTALLLLTAHLPLTRAFLDEIHGAVRVPNRITSLFFMGIYSLYCVFVSESVAPWFWILGVPVAIAIATSLLFTFAALSNETKRFLAYFAGLLALMSLLGIANTKRIMFISPWLILPVGVALAATVRKTARRALATALLFIAVIGWYGILSRNLYAAPHWLEPWETIAQSAADLARTGGIVIGDNPSFFFYLTSDLSPNGSEGARSFAGLLPDSIQRPNVYDAPQWIAAGRPVTPRMLVVKGLHFQVPGAPMDVAEDWLNLRCILEGRQRLVHDPGAELKQRFDPELGQVPWRIEILAYACK